MKRRALLTVTCAMALAMSCAAAADITLTEMGPAPEGAEIINGTNLLKLEGDSGYYYLADLDGNALTEAIYGRTMDEEKGYVTVFEYVGEDEINCGGMLSASGEVVLPSEYGDIKVLSSKWALGVKLKESDANQYDYQALFGDGYYLVDQTDIYYITEENASLVASLSREEFADAYAHGDYISVEDRSTNKVNLYDSSWNIAAEDIRYTWETGDVNTLWYSIYDENGQQGVKDADGNVIMEPSFKYVYDYKGKFAEVSTGEKDGLIDMEGNVVVPAEYDDIANNYYAPVTELYGEYSTPDAGGYFGVEKDGKGGFVAAGGAVTCEPTIASDVLEYNGASATYTDLTGKTHILSADGIDTEVPEGVSECRAIYYMNGFLYEISDDDYNKGVMDWHGNVLLPMENEYITSAGDGTVLMVEVDYDNAVYYAVNY